MWKKFLKIMNLTSDLTVRYISRRDFGKICLLDECKYGDDCLLEDDLFTTYIKSDNHKGLVAQSFGDVIGFALYDIVEIKLRARITRFGGDLETLTPIIADMRKLFRFVEVLVIETDLETQLCLKGLGLKASKVERKAFGSYDGYLFA